MTRNQKEAVALLSIGTFLEYFDLMIYVHMAVLLDTLFLPTSDARVAALLSAFAFCSTYLMRPVGAAIFGYIGDHIGRKTTIIFTTFMMAICCAVMASVPTYAQIGYMASIIVIGCRMLQGISSMGEIVGAEIYLSETIQDVPERYFGVAFVDFASALGTLAALLMASICTMNESNWRYAFWAGGIIGGISALARRRLREAPEFADMKRRMATLFEDAREKHDPNAGPFILDKKHHIWQQKVDRKTSWAYFFISSGWPLCFYFIFVYCANVLKKLGCTPTEIIHQNFIITIFLVLSSFVLALLTWRVHPLKLLKLRLYFFVPYILICPFVLTSDALTPLSVFCIQAFGACFTISTFPASAVFVIHFPIFKRFTYVSFISAITRAFVYIVNSFGLIYLTALFGHFGLWLLMFPICVAFYWGVRYFEHLEYQYSDEAMRETRDYMDTAPHLRRQTA